MYYKISDSIVDWMRFDAMIVEKGREAASSMIKDEEIEEIKKKYNTDEKIIELAKTNWEIALTERIEEQVDDIKEAYNCWLRSWSEGFKTYIEDVEFYNLLIEMEKIELDDQAS